MIFSTDAAGSLAYLSVEWTTLTGQDRASATGEGWLACVHAPDREIVRDVIGRAAAAATEFGVRFRLRSGDGSLRWIGAGGVPSFGPPGRTFLGHLGSMTELAPAASDGPEAPAEAHGIVGRFMPPPPHPATQAGEHLDLIADHLIIAHSLIVEDGGKEALPALREALREIGYALARRLRQTPPPP